jgi:hypothetical protein
MLNQLSLLFLAISIFALLFLLFYGSLSLLLKNSNIKIVKNKETDKKEREKKEYFNSNFDSDLEDYLNGFKNQQL